LSVSVRYHVLQPLFPTAALFHHDTGLTTYSAAPQSFDFILLFNIPSLEGLMVREGTVGSREDRWGVHGETSQRGLILSGGWGRIYFRTRNPFPSMRKHTLCTGETWALRAAALEGCSRVCKPEIGL